MNGVIKVPASLDGETMCEIQSQVDTKDPFIMPGVNRYASLVSICDTISQDAC